MTAPPYTIEILRLELLKDAGDIADSCPEVHIMAARERCVQILQVRGDDSALQDSQAIHGLQATADPVPGVRAGADPRIAILADLEDVIRIPHPVLWIIRSLGMIVETDLDIVLLHQLFKGIDRID